MTPELQTPHMTIRGIMISTFFVGVCITMHLNEPAAKGNLWLLLLPVFVISSLAAVGALVGGAKEFAIAGVVVSALFAGMFAIVLPISWLMRYVFGLP